MNPKIQETGISHAAQKKLQGAFWDESRWIGEDDKKIKYGHRKKPEDKSNDMTGVALEPQRIRSFEISYESEEKKVAPINK